VGKSREREGFFHFPTLAAINSKVIPTLFFEELPMPLDTFGTALDSLVAPARNCFSITPNDTAALPFVPKAIYIGTGGNLVIRAIDSSSDVTFTNVPNGTILDIRATSIRATGTSATNLIGLA
jgi:hypothetical protein